MRDLQVNQIELDEQWDFIQKKQKRVQTGDPSEFGDVWLFVALASTPKAVLECAPYLNSGQYPLFPGLLPEGGRISVSELSRRRNSELAREASNQHRSRKVREEHCPVLDT